MAQNVEQANLFELSNRSHSILITYSSTSVAGKPQLSYRDKNISRTFLGQEIRFDDTEIGQLVTVTLEAIPDLRAVTFTLVLTRVNVLPQSGRTLIRVPGILTTTHVTIAGQGLGAERTYSVVILQGTAQFVVF